MGFTGNFLFQVSLSKFCAGFLACQFVSLVTLTVATADEKDKDEIKGFVHLGFRPGRVVPNSDFFSGVNASSQAIESMQAFKVALGWMVDGEQGSQVSNRRPSIGFGIDGGRFDNGIELGAPIAGYGFLSWPLLGFGTRFDVMTDVSFGAAFNWEPFDAETNPFNDAVSTRITFYTDWSLYALYSVNRRLDLVIGGAFTHFSNGGTGYLNKSVNIVAPHFGLRMNLLGNRSPLDVRFENSTAGHWEIAASGGGGWKNILVSEVLNQPYQTRNFGVSGINVEFKRYLTKTRKLGAGIDASYDGSANMAPSHLESTLGDKLSLGIYGGYEHVFSRFSIPIGLGYYLVQGREDNRVPSFYQKLGWTVDLSERIFFGFEARFFNFNTADFVIWKFGWRLRG